MIPWAENVFNMWFNSHFFPVIYAKGLDEDLPRKLSANRLPLTSETRGNGSIFKAWTRSESQICCLMARQHQSSPRE